MARGAPDDSNVKTWGDTHRVTDLGELAARLGDILSQRRSGEWLFMENWSHGTSFWDIEDEGAGSTGLLSGTASRSAGVSLQMDVIAAAVSYVSATAHLPVLAETRVGIQCDLYLATHPDRWTLTVSYFTGEMWYQFTIGWHDDDMILYYNDDEGDPVTLDANLDLALDELVFHNLKLVVDLVKGEYVRFEVNKETFDLEGVEAWSDESPRGPFMIVGFSLAGDIAAGGRGYLDNIIITRNEV